MPLEAGDFIPELNANNPLGSDPKSEGDDHLRLVKRCTLGSFPAFVGNNAAPKSVLLTEDQINDAALKSEAATIGGLWDFLLDVDFQGHVSLHPLDSSLRVRNFGNTDYIPLVVRSSTSDVIVWGNTASAGSQYHGPSSASAHRFYANGIETFRTGNLLNGSAKVADRGGLFLDVGFRSPTEIGGAVTQTMTQEMEGRVVNFGSGGTVTLDALAAGTAITITNRGGGINLVEGTATIRWLSGDGVNNGGNRSLVSSSVIQCYWRASSQVEIWGNGIS